MTQAQRNQGVTRGRVPEDRRYDVVVIGGGVAGFCAAVAAARLGSKVALVQDRPVLGGNSSSEIRVWAIGAGTMGYFRCARETGLIEEVTLETAYRSEGLPPVLAEPWPLWDLVLKEWCNREPGLDLYLNSRAYEVTMAPEGNRISSVTALQTSTEQAFRLHAEIFIESSGDGEIGDKAGAIWRLGQESRHEFGESIAPEEANRTVLPNTIMFCARDAGRPVPFHPPDWAYDFPSDEEFPFRHPTYLTSGYWWIETGGDRDTINATEDIRDELYKILFGIWDHIKNHGDHGADNLILEWVGHVVGKRESRRFEGDLIMVQDDVLYGRRFPDAVAYGGWPIDLHPSKGFFDPTAPTKMTDPEKPFSIPYRCLYSRNVENLFLSGRLVSASHIAMGSIRVQKTLGTIGQAVGTAAAMCVKTGSTPRRLGQECIRELRQLLLKQDCYIPHVENKDPHDLARFARVTASSHRPLPIVSPDGQHPLYTRRAQKFVTSQTRIDKVSAWLVSERDDEVTVTVHLRPAPDLWDFATGEVLATTAVTLPPRHDGWVTFAFDQIIDPAHPYWVEIEASQGVAWKHSRQELHGCQAAAWSDDRFARPKLDAPMREDRPVESSASGESVGTHRVDSADGVWRHLRGTYAFRVEPEPEPYRPENVISGVARPEKASNLWMADPAQPWPHWLELDFGRPVTLDMLQLTFDSNLDRQMDEGAKALTGPVPEIVKSYTVLIWQHGEWVPLLHEGNNRQRWRRHRFDPVTTSMLRIVCEATHATDRKGARLAWPPNVTGDVVDVIDTARIFEIRVYHEPEQLADGSRSRLAGR